MQEVTMCCTTCPSGCALTVRIDDNDQVADLTGNKCPRGESFAIREWTDPVRTLTSTVYGRIRGKEVLIPVKTGQPISKSLMTKAMEEIDEVFIDHPVKMGDIIQENIAGSGVSLLACKTFV